MEIENLIKHMRKEAQDYRAGRTLGRAFADAEEVLDEAATALEMLQGENDRLKEEVQQMRWIPVEERKPKPSDNPILIYKSWDGRANFIGTAWYSSFHGWIPTNGTKIYGVTHWLPLPKAPKEDNL